MRVRQVVAVALVSAGTVVVADLLMRSTLLRILRPQVLSPADGAIVSGPVTVSWDGPQQMEAVLSGNGARVDLGLRENPFEIDETRFPRPGQYGVELRSPRFGSWIGADRRFMVRRGREREAARETAEAPPPDGSGSPVHPERPPQDDAALIAALAERDNLRNDIAQLQSQISTLREDNADLGDALDELQADRDARLAAANSQREELNREHLLALQENQLLHLRLDSIPACTAWGYVALPRPQTSPPSRLVVVSDRAGNVFRSEAACLASRQGDPTGASPCACVGAVWSGQ